MEGILVAQVAQGHNSYPPLLRGLNPNFYFQQFGHATDAIGYIWACPCHCISDSWVLSVSC